MNEDEEKVNEFHKFLLETKSKLEEFNLEYENIFLHTAAMIIQIEILKRAAESGDLFKNTSGMCPTKEQIKIIVDSVLDEVCGFVRKSTDGIDGVLRTTAIDMRELRRLRESEENH